MALRVLGLVLPQPRASGCSHLGLFLTRGLLASYGQGHTFLKLTKFHSNTSLQCSRLMREAHPLCPHELRPLGCPAFPDSQVSWPHPSLAWECLGLRPGWAALPRGCRSLSEAGPGGELGRMGCPDCESPPNTALHPAGGKSTAHTRCDNLHPKCMEGCSPH